MRSPRTALSPQLRRAGDVTHGARCMALVAPPRDAVGSTQRASSASLKRKQRLHDPSVVEGGGRSFCTRLINTRKEKLDLFPNRVTRQTLRIISSWLTFSSATPAKSHT